MTSGNATSIGPASSSTEPAAGDVLSIVSDTCATTADGINPPFHKSTQKRITASDFLDHSYSDLLGSAKAANEIF
jgi:hypothetical protein